VPLEDHKIALFIDFENIALGVKDTSYKTFDVQLVLARLLEKEVMDREEFLKLADA
jgi:hypothetical protein